MKTLRFVVIVILSFIAIAGILIAFGLRVELDGTGSRPIFSFHRRDAHFREIERLSQQDRAQPAAAPAAEPEPAPAEAAPEPVPAAVPATPAPAPWPSFYGPNRDGHYTATPILTQWPRNGLQQLWRRPIGGGYASMIVAEDKVFTIEQRRAEEHATAYDLQSGREIWTNSWHADFRESMGGPGPRATPAYDEGHVYVLGAEGELRCLDAAAGKIVWRRNILDENGASNLQWGMAASPLVVDGKVIVLPGGPSGRSVVAYDKRTGVPLWRSLDDKAAYAAPMAVALAGRRQLLVITALRAVGLSIEDGALLWQTPWRTEYDINSAMPIIIDANRFILTSGYGTGAALVEITSADAGFAAREVWRSQAMKCKFNNAVHHNGAIYGLDEGILAAMDVETGKRLWKGGRYGYGQLLLASGHLVIATEQGDVVLVEATPERHNEVARFSALDGKTWNVPAMAGGRLLVRNTAEMACYRVSP